MQPLDMGRVGTQAIFGDDHLEVRVVLAQFRDEAFGSIALTIVFAVPSCLIIGSGMSGMTRLSG